MRGWRKFNLSIPDFFHSLGEFGADCLLVLGRIQKVDQRQSRFFLCIVGGHLGKAKDRALIVLGVGKGFDVGQSFVWGGLMPLQQWAAKTSWPPTVAMASSRPKRSFGLRQNLSQHQGLSTRDL